MVMLYPVSEVFTSIQGEGIYVGTPANFIRLAGCPNNCSFCDTDYSKHFVLTTQQILERLDSNISLVVITGGEPTIHDLTSLVSGLTNGGYRVHLETSGIKHTTTNFQWVSVSPKKGKLIALSIIQRANEVKWLVPLWTEQEICDGKHAFNNFANHFVQPINSKKGLNHKNCQLAVQYALRNPWLRVSPQLHKILKVR